ncbi:Fe-S cluster assembly protein HesB [Microbacterium sp. YY-01]|uniref:Fe-S cluster assembly protein HesB n=1 Tax=Microbacterium sp. YY-01 TaxID=3421634 RepID=UPI003D167D40
MLTLTDNARVVVSDLVTNQSAQPDAGLRIHLADPTAETPRFAVTIVDAPEAEDDVIDASGARVFLEQNAAVALTDKVLDAGVNEEGAVSFSVLPQAV